MATVVLQTAGAMIGTALGGPIGGMIGRAAGAIGGAYVDQQLFGPKPTHTYGPRLDSARVLSSREGAIIPRVWGRSRIAGEIVWATRFEETTTTTKASRGSKGGGQKQSKTTTYTYFANFAVGLCEGPVSRIGRIWADGKEISRTALQLRFHDGAEDQLPDPLIAAKQGEGNAPAYRGLAYVVFEHMALEDYGNRIPQIAVEVFRPATTSSGHIRAVNLIPGSTEFGYDPQAVVERTSSTAAVALNTHQTVADTDFTASLDDLQATCPNLQQVALVVAWFGDDLRAGECRVEPRVEVAARSLVKGEAWRVAGVNRAQARLVSRVDGKPAYGGTPSDGSVLRALADMKARGLRVCLNPFVMMDVPPDNQLPDPYGAGTQATFPWRGRITCAPAPDLAGSPDRSAFATEQADAFAATAAHGWTYRRMVLHYAGLAAQAGGVDMFIIGSELRGLTRLRDENDGFPFVRQLVSLALEVREILGADTRITYGADWSEYFGFHPQDGSGDVFFNLDPLWACEAIDAVGIDNYMPSSDWRPGGAPDGVGRSSTDGTMLDGQIAGGEGFDWYYASDADRAAGARSPITDGLGKPWTFRNKDIRAWWSEQHFERRGGVEEAQPTEWVPQSKPVVFTELGCPAVHNGPAQPNVFIDPKSDESARPYHSSGARDDGALLAHLDAHERHWLQASENPVSAIYGEPMVDQSACQIWAWDARPFPAFPTQTDAWSDGANWTTGHWLNGRLGAVSLAVLLRDLCAIGGVTEVDCSDVNCVIDGYVLADPSSAREALETLLDLYSVSVAEEGGTLVFRSPGRDPVQALSEQQLAFTEQEPAYGLVRAQAHEVPKRAVLRFLDVFDDYDDTAIAARSPDGVGQLEQSLGQPVVASASVMRPVLERWLAERSAAREAVTFELASQDLGLTVGDLLSLPFASGTTWRITEIEDADTRRMTAVGTVVGESPGGIPVEVRDRTPSDMTVPLPLAVAMDLPNLTGTTLGGNVLAVTARPWPGPVAIHRRTNGTELDPVQVMEHPATMGRLLDALPSTSAVARWSDAGTVSILLDAGSLSSIDRLALLSGSNAFAVESVNGRWEVLQAREAVLVGPDTYALSHLLRGQAGTEGEALEGAPIGARIVLLDGACEPLPLAGLIIGAKVELVATPTNRALGSISSIAVAVTPGRRASEPLSPVHLRAETLTDGTTLLDWVRRDRLAPDDWDLAEIPMSEEAERYAVHLTWPGGALDLEATGPRMTIPDADLPVAALITATVSQLSATFGAGAPARLTFST